MTGVRTATLVVAAVLGLAFPARADDPEAVAADMTFYVTLTGHLLETAVALDEVSREADGECAFISILTFAARSSALGYQVSQLSMLRRLAWTEDPELRAFAEPRHAALRSLLPGVMDRDLRLIAGHLESASDEGWPPRFHELLRDLESTLRLARDMMSGDGSAEE